MALFEFVCDLGVNDQPLGVIVQYFYLMLEFTAMDPLSVYESTDLCDELTGPF